MIYKARFTGRQLGAIGIFHKCSDIVEAENEEAARLKLYDKWDSITDLKLDPLVLQFRKPLTDSTGS